MHQIIQKGRLHTWDECTNYQANLTPPDPTWPVDVRAVAAYIHANLFANNLMVAKVKRECGIGDNNISGRFRYYVGQGIKEYIDNHRINLAKRLLFRNSSTILVIALKVGYPSHSAFAMGFKRHVGCSPAIFRKHVAEKFEEKVEEETEA